MDGGVMGDVVQDLAVFGIAGDAIAQQLFGKCIGVFRYAPKNLIHTQAASQTLASNSPLLPLALLSSLQRLYNLLYLPECCTCPRTHYSSLLRPSSIRLLPVLSSRHRIERTGVEDCFWATLLTDTTTVLY
jgi:hypothetical protein